MKNKASKRRVSAVFRKQTWAGVQLEQNFAS